MALSSLSGFLQFLFNWNTGQAMPASSLSLPPGGNASTQGKKFKFNLGTNVAKGANEAFFFFVVIAPNGTATINLQSLTDVLQFSGLSLARIKSIYLALLSATDDATNGSPASSVTVGNAGAAPNKLFMTNPTMSFDLTNGDGIGYATGGAAGIAVNAGAQNLQIKNNDAVNAACVLIAMHAATS